MTYTVIYIGGLLICFLALLQVDKRVDLVRVKENPQFEDENYKKLIFALGASTWPLMVPALLIALGWEWLKKSKVDIL